MTPVTPRSVDIKSLPQRHLACVQHVGPCAGDVRLFNRLFGTVMAWARPKGLVMPTQYELITIYHDDSRITPEAARRISVGVTVPPGTPRGDTIEVLEIPTGNYLCALFEIDSRQYEMAWDHVRDVLMPRCRLLRDNGPWYECYLNDPSLHPQGKHVVEIRISVKSMDG